MTGIDGIWLIARRRERTKASSGVRIERMINNIEQEDGKKTSDSHLRRYWPIV
jgi:hypothetical protein